MNIRLILEDFRKDQYVAKPIVSALMSALGKSRARVSVVKDPLISGVSEALDSTNIREIIERYIGMTDLFILCVDRDGNEGRKTRLEQIEKEAASLLGSDKAFLAENAWQELEVWILAGHELLKGWVWKKIRAEIHPKEKYFIPFVERKGLAAGPGGGRKSLSLDAAKKYQRIKRLCPEDVGRLEQRIEDWLSEGR